MFFGLFDGLLAACKRCFGNDKDSSGVSECLLLKELQLYRVCRHPAIVACFGFMTVDTQKTLVLEHLSGGSLADAFGAGHKEKHYPAWSIHVLRDVAAALVHMHSQAYCCGDIQPRNVLRTCTVDAYLHRRFQCGAGVAAKLCDLGTALNVQVGYPLNLYSDLGVTRWNGRHGSAPDPSYAAPETLVYEFGQWTCEADVWLWGVLAWELITGRFAWAKLELPKVAEAVRNGARRRRRDDP